MFSSLVSGGLDDDDHDDGGDGDGGDGDGGSYKIWPQILTILIESQNKFNLLIIYLMFQSQDRTEINLIFRK